MAGQGTVAGRPKASGFIIFLIQPRSSPAVKKWGIFKSRLIASKSLRRYDIPYALHVHVADFKETFGTGKRSDAVHSDVKFASASFIVMLLMHNLKKHDVAKAKFRNFRKVCKEVVDKKRGGASRT